MSKFIIKTNPLSSNDLCVPFRVYLKSATLVSVTSIWIVLLVPLSDAPLAGVDQVKTIVGIPESIFAVIVAVFVLLAPLASLAYA